MKVILLQDVKDQGKKGQLVDVSDGYARNYLFPRKLAEKATADALNAYKLKERAKAEHLDYEKQQAKETAEKMAEITVTVQAKGGPNGRLFGSVTAADVAGALLSQAHIKLDKHKIVLHEAIKQTGDYTIGVKLGSEVTGKFTLKVELS